jgi:hypothetical protein
VLRRRAFDHRSARARRLDDIDHIDATLRRFVEASRTTLPHMHLHHFRPNGDIARLATKILDAACKSRAFALPRFIADIVAKAEPWGHATARPARTADFDEIAAQSAHRRWANLHIANREDVLFVSRKDGL